MKSRFQSGKSRIIVLVGIFIAVLMLVGGLMHVKLRALLRGNIERQVAAQAKGVAQVTKSELEAEVKKLETISGLFENGKVSMDTLFAMLQEEAPASVFGILELDGELILTAALT